MTINIFHKLQVKDIVKKPINYDQELINIWLSQHEPDEPESSLQ